MQVALYTVPNALWTSILLVNVFFSAIVQTNSLSSNVSNTTKNVWLTETILASILALTLQVQYTTSYAQARLNTLIAATLFALSVQTFLKRSGLSPGQQKFAVTTFAFSIVILIKYIL